MRTLDTRVTHLEGKRRAAAQVETAHSGAKEELAARLSSLAARITPEDRAQGLAPAVVLENFWRWCAVHLGKQGRRPC